MTRYLAAAILFSAALVAQTFNTGVFLGTVTDSSGAAVPGATVRAIRVDQPLTREAVTDSDGGYRIDREPSGRYRFEFEKTGFQKVIRNEMDLDAGQPLRVDATLPVGSVTDTVQVTAAAAQVDTATANVGSTISGKQVQELALNTRSFTQLMTLQPGVNSTQAQQPGFASNTSVPFSFNGGQTSANNWTLDGGRILDTYNGNNVTMVNLDAIAEVRIERNAYSAEYGRDSGAQVNVVSKSGTNDWQGTLFEFFRNDALDSRNFFAAFRPETRYNNFGGTVGGPVIKNRVFFFLSNEYRRIEEDSGTRTTTVPTAAQLAGNFAGGRTITDPLTGSPFPNNQIPTNRLDPNALILLKTWYPAPTPGFQQGALNFTSTDPDGTNYRSTLGRVDYNVKPNLTFFGRYNLDSTRLLSPYSLSNANLLPYVGNSNESDIMNGANLSNTWIISPTSVNQITSAFYHLSIGVSIESDAARARAPGFNVPRIFNSQTDSSGFVPSIVMGQGYAGIAISYPQNISGYTWELMDNYSHVAGRHSLRFGGNIDKENKSQTQSNPNNNGSFTLNGSATGDSLADMLLGKAYQYTESSTHIFGVSRWTDFGLYAQDDFRANNRLSLNFGVRYGFFQPEHDTDGHYSYFLPRLFNPAQAAVVQPNGQIVPGTQNFNNGLVIAGKGTPFGYAMTNTVHDVFDPRGGFSYALTKDNLTVLRGGAGVFHDRWSQFVSNARSNYPFNQGVSIFNTNFSNPGQGTQAVFPVGLTSFNSPWKIPSLVKWSLGVQRQMPGSFVLDVSYVGSRGNHLLLPVDINQPAASIVAASGVVSPNSVRPYPGFTSINSYQTTGESIYHSLQTSMTRRFSGGLTVEAAYTWSKTRDNAVQPMNSYESSHVEWATSTFDRQHVLVVSYVYELPFARRTQGATRAVLHGWQISGIASSETGLPLAITIPSDRAGSGDGLQRPNVAGPVSTPHTIAHWFNTAPFSLPALGTFGSAARTMLRAPGFTDFDLSFSKRFALWSERSSLQFRGEFFNIFNHTQLSGVGTSFGAGTFGAITSARDPRITQLGLHLVF
jgi:hypothetical protein